MSDVTAILALLDDQDPLVQESLVTRLGRDRGLLDQAWTVSAERDDPPPATLVNLVLAADAEELVDRFNAVDDLESGMWLLPRLHLPRHDYRTAGAPALDQLAARLPPGSDGGAVARFLCDDCGFAGDRADYLNPANSYLPQVLERRLGLPIALTALWMLVGRRIGLDLEAVAAPGHVVGRWRGGLIDLFAGGTPLALADLEERARAAGEVSALPYLAPASDRALLRRMARNLVNAYGKAGDRLRATIAHGMMG